MSQVYEMAVDALGLAISSREKEREKIPSASPAESISISAGEFLVIVGFDFLAYKKRTNSRAVKKTLSIPEWLNEASIAAGLNFSQILKKALIQKINR